MEQTGPSIFFLSCGVILIAVMVIFYVIFRLISRKLGSAANQVETLMQQAARFQEQANRDNAEPSEPDPMLEAKRDAMLQNIKSINKIECPFCETRYVRDEPECPNCGASRED